MLKNYLKIALRNLLKQRIHSGINLLGMALGLAGTILIALWINRELSVNQFHEHKGELYRILEHQTYGDDIFTFTATPGPLAAKLKADFPEITHATRSSWGNRALLSYGGQSFYERGRYVDPDFLKIFTFPLLRGNTETVLTEPNSIVLGKELAEKYFVGEQPVGKTIKLDNDIEYKVTGVLDALPENSLIRFDFLLPFSNFEKKNEWVTNWNNNGIQTYFRVQPGISAPQINEKVKKVVAENGQENVELLAHPLADWYLRSEFKDGQLQGGRIRTVRLFGVIAIFILLIGCINFMNLSTAKSSTRSLEVGVRKVLGGTRQLLAGQFLAESMLMVVVAAAMGIGLTWLALPYFNELFGLELTLASAGTGFWVAIFVVVLLTGLLAGSYPAFFLSGFQPIKVLKGLVRKDGGATQLRKGLVVLQFTISVFLIISTLVIYKQIEMIKSNNLGYDKENLLFVPVNGTLLDKYDAVKTELLQLPAVSNVSATNGHIHAWGNNTSSLDWEGKNPDESILFQTIPVSYDFVKTIGATLKDGRDFSPDFPSDSTNFLINETAAELMGMDNPVGQTITLWDQSGRVVGLLDDFHVGSLHQNQDPVILFMAPWKNFIYIRTQPNNDLAETLASLEKVFTKHNPAYPFEYQFTDQKYEELHRTELRTGALAKVFSFLGIFVSCLGLFGLAAFSAERRRREIGIRKVLGASIPNLIGLMSKDFIRLVLVAIIIASPIAWYFMNNWLEDFAYRIDIHWGMIALAGGAAIIIAALTVGTQSMRAALADPVESLKTE